MSRARKAVPHARTGVEAGRSLAAASAAMSAAARQEAGGDGADAVRRTPRRGTPKSRIGKKGLVIYVLPEVTLALRKLALDANSDVQRLGHRALELLFAEHGRRLPGAAGAASAKP